MLPLAKTFLPLERLNGGILQGSLLGRENLTINGTNTTNAYTELASAFEALRQRLEELDAIPDPCAEHLLACR